tara:strand:- start:2149 stop:3129 length:981 start_codon:yes stop_codon:yes gene_type:complete
MKILIIRLSSLGDIVLSTPIPRLLKKKFPKSDIHFITKKDFCSIYNYNINVDKVIEFNDNLFEVISKLKNENYDLIIDLHNNLRSNYIKFKLGKPSYTYKKQFIKRWLFTNFKIPLRINHITSSYINCLSKLNIVDDGDGLDFYIDEISFKKVKTLPGIKNNNFTVVIVGAKHFTKRLPPNKLIELCDKINGPIVLVGGRDEIESSNQIESFFNYSKASEVPIKLNKKTKIFNYCGKLSISESASVLKLSKMVYSHDTGFMHIAAALNKNLVAIFGSTHPNLGFYPYKTLFSVIQNNNLDCRPCTKIGLSKCPAGHFKCMIDIKFE